MGKPALKPFSRPPAWVGTAKHWLRILSISRLVRWAIYVFVVVWWYQNWWNDRSPEQLAARYALPESRFIPVGGMNVHCRISGQGEPILLLHDENNSLHTWNGWTDSLSGRYRVISVDLPGFGLTGPHPRGSYSAFMYAGFLDDLVRALDLQEFILAGNGLGAQIAWFYATEHPERLRKLILLNAPGFEEKTANWIQVMARTPVLNRILWKITPRYFLRLYLEDVYADDRQVDEALVQRHFDLLLRAGNRKALTDRAQVSENRPPVDLIGRITTPTLILWGAEDTRISPEYAYEFHRSIRSAFLKIYQNTGHWPQQENPVQTVQDVMAFLEERF
jgi:pimeloyl-ACP methyl ester carboxylesterase